MAALAPDWRAEQAWSHPGPVKALVQEGHEVSVQAKARIGGDFTSGVPRSLEGILSHTSQ